MKLEQLTYDIRAAAFAVHSELGPGLLESAYESCLVYELQERRFRVSRQVLLPLHYKGVAMGNGYRTDLIVNQTVLLELKSVKFLEPIHRAQVLTYLRLSGLSIGLLINFNVLRLCDGIERLVHRL